jgi:hypothetical protein
VWYRLRRATSQSLADSRTSAIGTDVEVSVQYFPGRQPEDTILQVHVGRLDLDAMADLDALGQRLLVQACLQGCALQGDERCAVALRVCDEVLVPECLAGLLGLEE